MNAQVNQDSMKKQDYRAISSVGIPQSAKTITLTRSLPLVKKYKVSIKAFKEMYNSKEILEPELDLYFTHDSNKRKSMIHRTDLKESKPLVTVDLNSSLQI